jgi:PTH1 family peptidyl-tRNA hydrolase
MRLIVGLGNPGSSYRDTRHNLGYRLLDEICRRNDCGAARRESRCLVTPCRIGSRKVLLARPATWMNTSGPAVRALLDYREMTAADVLVAHDDVDLELGQIRIRPEGGAGGHRGIESLAAALGTFSFARLRMGLGRPPQHRETADWVLEPFGRGEERTVEEMISWAAEAAESIIEDGVEPAMNRYNRWPREEP